MRQIKFRAWDGKEMHNIESMSFWNFGEYKGKIALQISSGRIGVAEATDGFPKLMQFTGLLDKNDKEIYEGDVYKIYAIGNGVVEFKEGKFIVRYGNKTLQFVNISSQDEVIGNIYENPELFSPKTLE